MKQTLINLCLAAALTCFAAYLFVAGGTVEPGADGPPVPGSGLHALIVFDRLAENPPVEIADIEESTSLIVWLKENGFEARRLPMQTEEADILNESEWIKSAFALPRESVPWLTASNGTTGYNGPVTSIDDIKSKLESLK